MESVRAGRRFAGRYRLAEQIGAGGMAEVWRGTDEVLARPVAVKVIDPALLADPAFRDRFRAEARAAAGLAHPRVVTVYDYGEEDGTPYIVMELLEGETLADRLGRGPLPPGEAATVCGQIASALAAAHAAGLVHRDVKPANVYLTRDGVKVLDFGLAARDQTGPVMGTPAYLAPEQFARGPVTPAADVFALGAVLYEALTGRRAFGPEFEMDDERSEPLPADLPAVLADIGARCITADPAARPTAAEIAAALDPSYDSAPAPPAEDAGDVGVPPERPGTWVLADPAGIRRPRLIAVAVAVAVVLAVVTLVVAGRDSGRPPTGAPGASTPAAPMGVLDALTLMRRTIDEGAAAGEVRADVAVDFDNLITDLQGRIAAGESVDVAARVAQLRVKIDQRLGEGGLSAARARDLRAALSGIP